MNYQKIYDVIVARAQNRTLLGYSEKHHIVPRCLGGTNAKSNIVALTAEEHFVAHQLLVKLHPDHGGLYYALWQMTRANNGMKRNNKAYGWIKRGLSETTRAYKLGKKLPDKTRKKMSESHKGKTHSEETKRKIAAAASEFRHSEETKQKLSEINRKNPTRGHAGYKHSAEARDKMSEAAKKRVISKEQRMKMVNNRIGLKRSPETIEKMRQAALRRWGRV